GCNRIEDAREYFVIQNDLADCFSRRLNIDSDDARQDIADEVRGLSFTNECRPVLNDRALPDSSRHIFGSYHPADTWNFLSARGVDFFPFDRGRGKKKKGRFLLRGKGVLIKKGAGTG